MLRTATKGAAFHRSLRREYLIAVASLLGLAALAWIYLWIDAGRMEVMNGAIGGMAMPAQPWRPGALALTFLMWSVMMTGMMLPSAMPAMMIYATLVRKHFEAGSILASFWIFAAGYVAVWTCFASGATLLQAALDGSGLLTPAMSSANRWLTGGLLIAAAIYQWLPLKEACLNRCREPLQFFLFRWRAGRKGAFLMGAEHGCFCVACCWMLMLLLFAVGVMNLLWVTLLAGYVLVEKCLPRGRAVARTTGLTLGLIGLAAIFADT